MFNVLLALHLLFAVFAIGPLAHAATTAARGVRTADAAATAASARVLRIYSYASLLVVIFGFGLMSQDDPHHKGQKVAQFGQTWVWLSFVLWVVAIVIVLALVAPALRRAGELIGQQQPVAALTARVAAGGGVVAALFAVIVFLMVYRPGA